jgi:hypothetical protein
MRLNQDDIVQQIDGHAARNADLLQRIRDLGARLEVARAIELHSWAPTREIAGILVERLIETGLTDLTATPPIDDGPWSVEGQLHESPLVVASSQRTAELVRLAADCGGQYDGWGTSISEAAARG